MQSPIDATMAVVVDAATYDVVEQDARALGAPLCVGGGPLRRGLDALVRPYDSDSIVQVLRVLIVRDTRREL